MCHSVGRCLCSHCLSPLFIRTLGLKRPGVSSMVGVLLILAFTSHVSYLTFVSFDYGYNMAANATIGTANAQEFHLNSELVSAKTYFNNNVSFFLPYSTFSAFLH